MRGDSVRLLRSRRSILRVLVALGRSSRSLTGLVAGVGPALLETRRLHGNPMRTMASSDRVRQRWRHALVVIEIAVTVALLVVTAHDDRRLPAQFHATTSAIPRTRC